MPAPIVTPEWVKDAVFYQIFPDRFAMSDKIAKPGNLQRWGSQPTEHGYQGGDLLGVAEHLDYLSDLGISAIYFTPIFQSASNHRYHTHDYEKVDPLLGGNAAFRTLIEEAHKRDMRVVLDGVFNHASRGFFQFNDILENGSESAWRDWFIVERWPLNPYDTGKPANYVSWWGNRALPKLNTANPEVREFIMRIAEHWLRDYEIDGWRLDVPMEITAAGFWQEFRQRVKAVNPEAYIVGEVWTNAAPWLKGDQFDAVMNYLFAAAVIAFTGGNRVTEAQVRGRSYDPYPGINASQFDRRIQTLLNLYDWQVTLAHLNLLASHDTARVLSIVRGDKATLRLATLFQMTFPGAPCIYYGDEIGIRGSYDYDEAFRDFDARWAFPWNDRQSWDLGLSSYVKSAIALRRSHPALRRGSFTTIYARDDCFAYVRKLATEALVIAINAGTVAHTIALPVAPLIADGSHLVSLFGPQCSAITQNGTMSVSIPPREGVVLA